MTDAEIPSSELPRPDAQMSRKGFLKQGLGFLMSQIAESLPEIPRPEETIQTVVRPPGALPSKAFLSRCQPFCTECHTACPRGSIFQDRFGLPYIQAEVSPCVMCLDVPCTKVCPTGALISLEEPTQIDIGTAVIELTVCTAYQGSGCKACHDACPIPGEAIQRIEGLPQIVPDRCTGCGICVYACPTPKAIFVHPKQP